MSAWKIIKSVGNTITVGFGLYILMKSFYEAGKDAERKVVVENDNQEYKKAYDNFYKDIMG